MPNYFTPPETIKYLVEVGNGKGHLPFLKMVLLGLLAGAYIGFGAHLSTVVTTGIVPLVGYGLAKFIAGTVFSVGLMLVIIAGAELFTGNTLMIISLFERRITLPQLVKNWSVVYLANFVGALIVVGLIFYAGLNGSGTALTPVGQNAVAIASAKTTLPPLQIFLRGILANWLVCLAVVMAAAARDITGKILAIFVPVMAFVAMGFEHSIANMYYLPAGMLAAAGSVASLAWSAGLVNIGLATLGNIIGGALFVGCAYWLSYRKEII